MSTPWIVQLLFVYCLLAISSIDSRYAPVKPELKGRLQKLWNINLDQRSQRYKAVTDKWVKSQAHGQSESDTALLKTRLPITRPGSIDNVELFKINEQAGLTPFLWEGDIHLTDNQLRVYEKTVEGSSERRRRQVTSVYSKWTDGIVYYSLDSGIDDRKRKAIKAAHAYISNRTCIRFLEDNSAKNRINVINGGGCYSSVGMIGGVQTLSIGNGCEVIGTVAHEFSHALGVWHMQSRDDRDNYVSLDLQNVPTSTRYNFAKLASDQIINYTPYEYGSFMHYGANAFSTNYYSPSIIPHDVEYTHTMGNRLISFYDISLLNQHYNCLGKCTKKIMCYNGGEQNPADCSSCNCPLGYGGHFCESKPDDGGVILSATSNWQKLQIELGKADGIIRDSYDVVTYWIKAPTNKKIEFIIGDMINSQCNYGCAFNGIELKVKSDQKIVNPRYCCTEFKDHALTSEVNPTPIIAFNRYDLSSFTISYRYVDSEKKEVVYPDTTPHPETSPVTTTSSNGICKDYVSQTHCNSLMRKGFCNSTEYSAALVKFNCAESCDLCGKSPKICSDTYEKCDDLKAQGYCKSTDRMLVEYYCAKTCGFCEKPN